MPDGSWKFTHAGCVVTILSPPLLQFAHVVINDLFYDDDRGLCFFFFWCVPTSLTAISHCSFD